MNRNTISKHLKKQAQKYTYYPERWNKNIIMDNGKPDLNAIAILLWLMRIYAENAFSGNCFQVDYKTIMKQTNLTHEQAKKAVRRLVERGLIIQELEKRPVGNKGKYLTDMWLIPNVKIIDEYSRHLLYKRPKNKRPKTLTAQQRAIIAAYLMPIANTPIAVHINTAIKQNNKNIEITPFYVVKVSRLIQLLNEYGVNWLLSPVLIPAVLSSKIPKKKIISSYSSNAEKLFNLFWNNYFYKKLGSTQYYKQFEYSRLVIEPLAAYGESKGMTMDEVYQKIVDRRFEIERSYRAELSKDEKNAWRAKRLNEKVISFWLKDMAPHIPDWCFREGFWQGAKGFYSMLKRRGRKEELDVFDYDSWENSCNPKSKPINEQRGFWER